MIRVLFVCLGNICRSPLAEAVFNDLLKKEGLQDKIICDSAGTSDYHIGAPPDERSLHVVREKGLRLNHQARQFTESDFSEFHYIIAMDQNNRADILELERLTESQDYNLFLMREFEEGASDLDVPDPYWSGEDGFLHVYEILSETCQNLLNHIRSEKRL